MSTQPAPPSRVPMLNLRVLQTDTERRFVLLLFAVFSTSVYMFRVETVTLFLQASFSQCLALSLSAPGMLTINALNVSCSWQSEVLLFIVLLLSTLLLVGCTAWIYHSLPTWRLRQGHLKPFIEANENARGAIGEIEKLRAHLTRVRSLRIQYVREPAFSRAYPVVFGRGTTYYISLSDEFVQLFSKDLERFRTIILHELSHIQNKDVNRYYVALAALYAFTIAAFLPFLLFLVWSLFHLAEDGGANTMFVASNVLLGIIFMLEMRALYCAVLRSREVYADIQAVQWVGSPQGMEHTLACLPPSGRRVPFFSAFFATHPLPEERNSIIQEPEKAFGLKFWEALGIGIVSGLAYPSLHDALGTLGQLLAVWLPKGNYPSTYPDPGTLSFCLFVVPLVWWMIWRAAIVEHIRGQSVRGAGRLGVCLAAGLMLGFAVSLSFTPFVVFYRIQNVQILLVYMAPWLLLFAAGVVGFCIWQAFLASLWLKVLHTQQFFRMIATIQLLVAALIVAFAFALLQFLLLATLGYMLPGHANVATLTHPIVLQPVADSAFYWRLFLQALFLELLPGWAICGAFVGLWAIPLLSRFWYRPGGPVSRCQWALADPRRKSGAAMIQDDPLHLRFTAFISLAGAFIGCGLVVPLRLQAGQPATINGPGGAALLLGPFLLPSILTPLMLASFVQVGVTVIIALRPGPGGMRMITGLFGAFLSGCVMALGTILIFLVRGGLKPGGVENIFLYDVTWGAVCALGAVSAINVARATPAALAQIGAMVRPEPGWRRRVFGLTPLLIATILLLIFALFSTAARPGGRSLGPANLVQDGDFEEPVVLDASEEFNAGQSFGSWHVESGSVDIIGTRWVPARGAQSVALSGTGAGILSQDLSTNKDATYSLSFALAGDPECGMPALAQVQVWWGSTLVTTLSFLIRGYSWIFVGWRYYTYIVHASETRTHLSFISLTPPPCGPTLDDVRVTA